MGIKLCSDKGNIKCQSKIYLKLRSLVPYLDEHYTLQNATTTAKAGHSSLSIFQPPPDVRKYVYTDMYFLRSCLYINILNI